MPPFSPPCSHYVYRLRSTRIERVGPWLPPSWLSRALSRGAEVSYTESDAVSVRPDAGNGGGNAAQQRAPRGGDGVERTLRRTLRLRQARWLPGAEWRVVDIVDAA